MGCALALLAPPASSGGVARPAPQAHTLTVRRIPLVTNDLVVDRARQLAYVSEQPSPGRRGGVTPIDLATGEVGEPFPASGGASDIDISDDYQVLYAGTQRFDLVTRMPGFGFPGGGAIKLVPGTTDTLVVYTAAAGTFGDGTLRIFDRGVQRGVALPHPGTVLGVTSDGSKIYVAKNTFRASMHRYSLTPAGPVDDVYTMPLAFSLEIRPHQGRLYTTDGLVLDDKTNRPAGSFRVYSFSDNMRTVAPDSASGRVYFGHTTSGSQPEIVITAFDINTFAPAGSVAIPGDNAYPAGLSRWGADGLVFRTPDSVYIVQTTLVPPHDPAPTPTPLPTPTPTHTSFIGVTRLSEYIPENQYRASIPVQRAGDLSREATVEYETEDATATARADYTATFGTLRFAPGETLKAVEVLLTDDALEDSGEFFRLTLKNAAGAQLSPGFTTVTIIIANNYPWSTTGSLQDAAFFVRSHYHDFLGRDPGDDPEGFAFWTDQINSCRAEPDPRRRADCLERRRVNVSAAFFLSVEFQQTGYLAYKTHAAAFGRRRVGGAVPLTLREFLPDRQAIGDGVVVNRGDWKGRLEANKVAFFDKFVARPQFLALYTPSMPAAEYVDALNLNAGGPLSQAERDGLVAELLGGARTRAQVLRAVAEDADLDAREKNRAFVLMQYFGYLRRDPDDAPDSDFAGYLFWLSKLDEHGGNFVSAEMVKAFLVSGEYTSRFGPTAFNIGGE